MPKIALDKSGRHFSLAIANETIRKDSAFVLVINAGYCEIDFLDLELTLDSELGRNDIDLSGVSAILMYKADDEPWGVRIRGCLVQNPSARNPLTKEEIAEFNTFFLPQREPIAEHPIY